MTYTARNSVIDLVITKTLFEYILITSEVITTETETSAASRLFCEILL